MSYNKRTSIRATRGEEMTFDELHGSKLKALINMAIALVISFSLVIAFTPLASVSSAFADPTEDPETPGITDENGDGIDDKYQIVVTYKVVNGSWDDGTTANVTETVTLLGADDQPAEDGTATLADTPAVGNEPNANYKAGKWDTESGSLPTTISASDATDGVVTYIYTYVEKAKYTVTFDTDGGSAVASQEVYEGGNATEPSPAPTKAGNTFDGWQLNGATYSFDTPVDSNITLTAKWIPVSTPDPEEHVITITYKVEYGSWNDGSAQPKTQSLTLTGDASGALEPPAVGNAPTTNCKAGKWKTESGELPATITYADTTDGEITYTYAYAQKEQFTITFDSDGGSAVQSQQVYEGDFATKPANPTKAGMSFAYWVTADGAAYKFDTTPVIGNLTLKAIWMPAAGQWKSNSTGKWYEYSDGSYIKNDWLNDGGKWYHFNSYGYMQTGWQETTAPESEQVNWYYFDASGAMATGWRLLNGTWYYLDTTTGGMYENGQYPIAGKKYYFNSNGAMQTGWVNSGTKEAPIWYYYDASGAMATGWAYIGSTWYYLDPVSGIMVIGAQNINGKEYFFANDGTMVTGWNKVVSNDATNWYYYDASGAMVTGKWIIVGGTWYYMGADGVMEIGQFSDGKANYYANASGAMQTGWVNTGTTAAPIWYYYGSSGAMQTGWQVVGGAWYYMNPDNNGIMETGQFSDGKANYYANASGAMQTGWVNTGTTAAPIWYYYGPSGAMVTNAWAGDYWLGDDGKMVTDSWVDNDKYYVGPDGKWDSSKKPAADSGSETE